MYRQDADGTFIFDGPKGSVRIGRKIALIIDAKTGTLLKHGAPAPLSAYHDQIRKTPIGHDAVMIAADWKLGGINRLLATTGAAAEWWKTQQNATRDLLGKHAVVH